MGEFIRAAGVSEIPEGTGRSLELAGRRVALFNVGGSFHAIEGTCPHRGGPLGEGFLKGRVVTCPWHFWQFDVVTGAAPDLPEACLRSFPVKVSGEDVLVSLDGAEAEARAGEARET